VGEFSGTADADCIRCGSVPAIDEDGYCGYCHWASRAEAEQGFQDIRDYLRKWRAFMNWCAENGRDVAA
jgi:hypothetical protein